MKKQAINLWMNCLFWAFHFYLVPAALYGRHKIAKRVKNISDVRRELSAFSWQDDKGVDWTPWVLTFLARGKVDDCDGAAIYGRWLLKCMGVSGKLLRLRGAAGEHVVCISESGRFMVTNNTVVRVKGGVRGFILQYFDGRYGVINGGVDKA